MRVAFHIQRAVATNRKFTGDGNVPAPVSVRDVLECATVNGAACAGLSDKIGSLTPGKEADVVLLRADRLNVWPLNNAPGAVVNVMDPSNVDTVFIAGQPRKWRGSLVGVDEARVRRLVAEARDAVVRRSGFVVDLFG
jgi:5-methylthioadenosine/S-adenosylhomocysteine deaminase